ncbi:unnamed protein product [Parnassius apollo]|uniref:(apollo) hypothetical protein n=1 Tax=Parnassius apollo TaxID=110799 RepID=A0A8S3VZF5_PARAO|nr:unnamed protein product [Parnassius apollo]
MEHTRPSTFIFKDLALATHVFLRDDTVRRPQPPYTGPLAILQRRDKTLTLDVNGRKVSIDRVKPAYIENNEVDKKTTPPVTPATANTPPVVQTTPNNTGLMPYQSDTRVVKTRSVRCVRFRNILDI